MAIVGQAQRRDLGHQAERGIRLGGRAAQQLDEVEQRHQPGQRGQHAPARQAVNTPGDIERQGDGRASWSGPPAMLGTR